MTFINKKLAYCKKIWYNWRIKSWLSLSKRFFERTVIFLKRSRKKVDEGRENMVYCKTNRKNYACVYGEETVKKEFVCNC